MENELFCCLWGGSEHADHFLWTQLPPDSAGWLTEGGALKSLVIYRNQFPHPLRNHNRTVNTATDALRWDRWGNAGKPTVCKEIDEEWAAAERPRVSDRSCRCPSRGRIVCTPQLLLLVRLSIQMCYLLHSGPDSTTLIKICTLGTNGKHSKRWAGSSTSAPEHSEQAGGSPNCRDHTREATCCQAGCRLSQLIFADLWGERPRSETERRFNTLGSRWWICGLSPPQLLKLKAVVLR